MIFTKSPPGDTRFSPGPEIAALLERRCKLISQLAELADQIKMMDNRLHNLRSYEQVGRIGAESKATAEAAAKNTKEEGEA